jgi:hypothetical protein
MASQSPTLSGVDPLLEHANGTASFFQAMAPVLVANMLTVAVAFVYSFVKISQKELRGEEDGRLTYLCLITLVFLFMLYGLYVWGVYPLSRRLHFE